MLSTGYYAKPPQTAIEVALKEALKSWDAEEDRGSKQPAQPQPTIKPVEEKQMKAHLFPITTNVSRKTWEYVAAHPGYTTSDITKELTKQGFKPGSVASIVAQFVRQGHARKESDKTVYMISTEYQPLKNNGYAIKKANRHLPTKKSGIAALVAPPLVTTPAPKPKQETMSATQLPSTKQSAEDIVASVSIYVARDLYDILHKFFKNS
jgi:hypothetical protein